MMDRDRYSEYRQRLADRYTAAELVELLDISIDEALDAFEHYWADNKFLLEETGVTNESDEDN